MDTEISRSEKKRRAKSIEELAWELVKLAASDIRLLPCEDWLKQEISSAGRLKGPARKRQIKYIAKELRQIPLDGLLQALAEKKGSKLKQKKDFHELEHLRERIIDEALLLHDEAQREDRTPQQKDWQSDVLEMLNDILPDVDIDAIKKAALRYAMTRKAGYSREIFRLLNAAKERARYRNKEDMTDGI